MLKNSTIALLALFLLAIGVIFFQNASRFLTGVSFTSPMSEFNANDISGSQLVYKGTPYTLSLKQQMEVLDVINQAVPFEGRFQADKNVGFDKITFFSFGKNNINLIPIIYIKNKLVFQIPGTQNEYLIEESEGKLRNLIINSYDHA